MHCLKTTWTFLCFRPKAKIGLQKQTPHNPEWKRINYLKIEISIFMLSCKTQRWCTIWYMYVRYYSLSFMLSFPKFGKHTGMSGALKCSMCTIKKQQSEMKYRWILPPNIPLFFSQIIPCESEHSLSSTSCRSRYREGKGRSTFKIKTYSMFEYKFFCLFTPL